MFFTFPFVWTQVDVCLPVFALYFSLSLSLSVFISSTYLLLWATGCVHTVLHVQSEYSPYAASTMRVHFIIIIVVYKCGKSIASGTDKTILIINICTFCSLLYSLLSDSLLSLSRFVVMFGLSQMAQLFLLFHSYTLSMNGTWIFSYVDWMSSACSRCNRHWCRRITHECRFSFTFIYSPHR